MRSCEFMSTASSVFAVAAMSVPLVEILGLAPLPDPDTRDGRVVMGLCYFGFWFVLGAFGIMAAMAFLLVPPEGLRVHRDKKAVKLPAGWRVAPPEEEWDD